MGSRTGAGGRARPGRGLSRLLLWPAPLGAGRNQRQRRSRRSQDILLNGRAGRAACRLRRLVLVEHELQPPFPLNPPHPLDIGERARIALADRRVVTPQHRDEGIDVIRTDDQLDQERIESVHDHLLHGLFGGPGKKDFRPVPTCLRTGPDSLHEHLAGRDRQLRRVSGRFVRHALSQTAGCRTATADEECTDGGPKGLTPGTGPWRCAAR